MKLLTELLEGDKGTPIELANAILNLPMMYDTDNIEAVADHLRVEARRQKREEFKERHQGCLRARDE